MRFSAFALSWVKLAQRAAAKPSLFSLQSLPHHSEIFLLVSQPISQAEIAPGMAMRWTVGLGLGNWWMLCSTCMCVCCVHYGCHVSQLWFWCLLERRIWTIILIVRMLSAMFVVSYDCQATILSTVSYTCAGRWAHLLLFVLWSRHVTSAVYALHISHVMHVACFMCIYIYVCAVELKTGPRFGVSYVKNWSKSSVKICPSFSLFPPFL